MTNSKQTPLTERLRSWPAADGQDGLNSSYVGALMVEAAEALEVREASDWLAAVAVDAGPPLLDRVIEVLSGAMFTYVERPKRAGALLAELIAWRDESRKNPRNDPLASVNSLRDRGNSRRAADGLASRISSLICH
jgi:hypothetical protein